MRAVIVPALLAVITVGAVGCSSARYADDTLEVPNGSVATRPASDPAVLVTSDRLTDAHGPVLALVQTPAARYENGVIIVTGGREWMAVTGEPWRYYVGSDAEREGVRANQQAAKELATERADLAYQRTNLTATIRSEEVAPLEAKLAAADERERTRSARLIAAVAPTPDGDPLAERAVQTALAQAADTEAPIVKPADRDQLLAAINSLNAQMNAMRQEQAKAAAAAQAAEESRVATERALRERESSAATDRDRAAKSTKDLEQMRTDLNAAQDAARQAAQERDTLAAQHAELQKRFNDILAELGKSTPPAPAETGTVAPAAEPKP